MWHCVWQKWAGSPIIRVCVCSMVFVCVHMRACRCIYASFCVVGCLYIPGTLGYVRSRIRSSIDVLAYNLHFVIICILCTCICVCTYGSVLCISEHCTCTVHRIHVSLTYWNVYTQTVHRCKCICAFFPKSWKCWLFKICYVCAH